jgi:hypothetical protein
MAAKLVEDVTSDCPFNNKMFAMGMNEREKERKAEKIGREREDGGNG